MTTYIVGTDGVETSEKLLAYLEGRIEDGDTVYAVNSLRGGDSTSDEDVLEGTEALEVLEDGVGAESHQLVRGNSPQEDMLTFAEEHEADELVIGIRKRSPTGKMLFGSTAQDLLLETPIPVVTVPLVD
ncbi:universal stress protein [Halorarius halobius]|uniref:universal stress protein n=1 Tax=Halorarius halobius TaxID=2962671 RepID=UPI0020CFBBC1|nr:universal stress protein [Halorarius halobius]